MPSDGPTDPPVPPSVFLTDNPLPYAAPALADSLDQPGTGLGHLDVQPV